MNGVQNKREHRSQHGTTATRHRDLHDRLLDAAEEAIAIDGLSSIQARSLAKAVGCSVGAIYGVFADLDTLILMVNGRTLDAISAALQRAGGTSPADRLVGLANAYLDYAIANRARWMALFKHRMPPGQAITHAYAERQAAAFAEVEGPIAALCPALPDEDRAMLARSLFSAVHGMVELGLDERVAAMPVPVLQAQIRLVVEAIAAGLTRR